MTKVIRVGVAQLDYLPAFATQAVDYLNEPAPPNFSEKITSYLGRLKSKDDIPRLMKSIREHQIKDLESKISLFIRKAVSVGTDILIFPEYSIPCDILLTVRSLATSMKCNIVAGTHIVQRKSNYFDVYDKIGIPEIGKNPSNFVRKAICPIFHANGKTEARYKITSSKWEPELVLHEDPQENVFFDVREMKINTDIRICIDALSQSVSVKDDADLLCVVALSPSVSGFQDLFSFVLMKEVPGILANSALYGGSRLYNQQSANPSVYADLQEISVGSELLLVVELDLDNQFRRAQSVKTVHPSKVICHAPLLYESVPQHATLIEYIQLKREEKNYELEIERIEDMMGKEIPSELTRQIRFLCESIENGTAIDDDFLLLLDCIYAPQSVLPFWNRCEQALSESLKVLSKLIGDGDSSNHIIEAMAKVSKSSLFVKKKSFL